MTGTDMAMSVIVTILCVAGIIAAFGIGAFYTVITLSNLYYIQKGEIEGGRGEFIFVLVMIILDMGAAWVITHLLGVIKTIGLFVFG